MNDDLVNEIHRGYDSLSELISALEACRTLDLYDITLTTVIRRDGYKRNRACMYLDAKRLPKAPLEDASA